MDQSQEHPFVKVSKKKNDKQGTDISNPPTNQGGSMNPNEITPQASVQEAKKSIKEIGAERKAAQQSKNRKQLAKILPIAAAMNRSVKGLPPDPGITARLTKKKTDPKNIPYKQRANVLKKENDKVAGFERDASSYAAQYLAVKQRGGDYSNAKFSLHPDTARALATTQSNPSKLNTALKKRMVVRGAKPASGALVPVDATTKEPQPNINVQYSHDLDVVKYPRYKLQHSAIKSYDEQMHDYAQGKAPLNRQHLLAAIEKSRQDGYIKTDKLVNAARAQHELSTRSLDHAPASHWKREASAMRGAIDDEHAEKIRHVNHLFNQHAITHGEPYHANEISSEGYVRGTKENSIATQHPKKGIFSRIKKKLGLGEDNIVRIEKIKQIAEARNMFKASSSGAGRTRGGGVIRRQGATGHNKSPVALYKKQGQQTVKGIKKQAVSRQQAAAIAIAKQKQQSSADQQRQRASQYRIN